VYGPIVNELTRVLDVRVCARLCFCVYVCTRVRFCPTSCVVDDDLIKVQLEVKQQLSAPLPVDSVLYESNLPSARPAAGAPAPVITDVEALITSVRSMGRIVPKGAFTSSQTLLHLFDLACVCRLWSIDNIPFSLTDVCNVLFCAMSPAISK